MTRRLPPAPLLLLLLGRVGAQVENRRLRVTNGCPSWPMWIAHEQGPHVGPDPQNVRIEPLQHYDFATPDGLSATRYWPKMFCDPAGNNCGLGGSGGPQEKCVGTGDYRRCAPPIDTKFEATFGYTGQPCDGTSMAGCDHVDVSLVDGWTLPFKLELNGHCTANGGVAGPQVIDCQSMSFDVCPLSEFLPTIGQAVNLQATNAFTKKVAGCYSPCTKLIDDKWANELARGRRAQDPAVAPYCCPTPPESPEACRKGPIKDTAYVQAVHRFCPGVYSYSYDDAMGLYQCESATTYNMIFYCPRASAAPEEKPPEVQPTDNGALKWALVGAAVALLLAAAVASQWSRLVGQHQQAPQPMALPLSARRGGGAASPQRGGAVSPSVHRGGFF